MMESLILILFGAGYLFLSFKLHLLMYRVNKLSFFLLSVVYIVGTYYLIWLLEFLKQILSSFKIHLDFGHADSTLVEIILVCYLLAFVNLIVVCVRRFIR